MFFMSSLDTVATFLTSYRTLGVILRCFTFGQHRFRIVGSIKPVQSNSEGQRILLEKLIIIRMVKIFVIIYETLMFVAVLTTSRN
jgi:hypothetical protein